MTDEAHAPIAWHGLTIQHLADGNVAVFYDGIEGALALGLTPDEAVASLVHKALAYSRARRIATSALPEPDEATPTNGPWALWDVPFRLWLGDQEGALVYADDFAIARAAERLMGERFGDLTRVQLRAYDGTATVRRDEVIPKYSPDEVRTRLGLEDE